MDFLQAPWPPQYLMPGFGQRPSIPGDSPNRVDDLIPFLCQYFCCQRAASPVCTINQYHFPFRKRNIACLYFFQRQIYRHRNVTFRKFFARSNVNDDSSIVKSLTQDVPNINIMKSHRSASFLLTNRICEAWGFVSVNAFCMTTYHTKRGPRCGPLRGELVTVCTVT